MGQTVNLLAYAFGGSNPSLPTQRHDIRMDIVPLSLSNKAIAVAHTNCLKTALLKQKGGLKAPLLLSAQSNPTGLYSSPLRLSALDGSHLLTE